MRGKLLDAVTLVAAIAAVGLAAFSAVKHTRPSGSTAAAEPDLVLPDAAQLAQYGHRVGPSDASTEVVVFADYECPACYRFHRTLAAVRADYPNDLTVVYRNYPLSYHRRAYPAALAAECAALQGRFEEYNNALYEGLELLNGAWMEVAVRAALPDTGAFNACIRDGSTSATVERDIAAAREIGVRATPAVIINGVYLGSIPNEEEFRGMVARNRRVP